MTDAMFQFWFDYKLYRASENSKAYPVGNHLSTEQLNPFRPGMVVMS